MINPVFINQLGNVLLMHLINSRRYLFRGNTEFAR
ncbi:Uncharacterised protein [Vibrio cholerae]|nr:Uncharacterised protein [Vibrio cholerae]